jgi:hypothetical protein
MEFPQKTFPYDVFLSHAVEDKKAIADELNTRLIEKGVKVWYSGKELISGKDLGEQVRKGLYGSRFGLVIFSPSFFGSLWTVTELSWLESREHLGFEVIIPVLHNLTIEELAALKPPIASRFCIEANRGMDNIINRIVHEVEKERDRIRKRRNSLLKCVALLTIAILSLSSYTGYRIYSNHPSTEQVTQVIEDRIQSFLNTIESKYANPSTIASVLIGENEVDSIVHAYQNLKSYYRNEYEFYDGIRTIRGRKNVQNALATDLVKLADKPGYGMDSVDIYLSNNTLSDGLVHSRFALLNRLPLRYALESRKEGSNYMVTVFYSNEIRYIDILLTFASSPSGTKRHEMTLLGFPPSETFYFQEGADGDWHFESVE